MLAGKIFFRCQIREKRFQFEAVMNEIVNGAMSFTSMGVMLTLVVVGLFVWFFINRASVKATQQVCLLEALLEEQKRQNALLRKIAESSSVTDKAQSETKDFTRLVPER
ncbi:hypothetical protein AV903_05575 [Erwinia tracheiphila]|uniref:Uncharacterized protein n=2 Tax=Erwinia tracheiphila TaxID=65700 RepID=A0A345CQG9_9GAMM|nr:hypothetical protein AV903_05575 [Erwinia tracheiphila]